MGKDLRSKVVIFMTDQSTDGGDQSTGSVLPSNLDRLKSSQSTALSQEQPVDCSKQSTDLLLTTLFKSFFYSYSMFHS